MFTSILVINIYFISAATLNVKASSFQLQYSYPVTCQLTYLLTPWCRVLLQKLTGLQLVKKFPALHGTRRFITALTSVRQLSLSWASPIQSIYPHPTSWRSILILSTHLRLGLPSGLFSPLSSLICATCPSHLILLDFITRTILSNCRLMSAGLMWYAASSLVPWTEIPLGAMERLSNETTKSERRDALGHNGILCHTDRYALSILILVKGKGKVFPLQARCGPEGG